MSLRLSSPFVCFVCFVVTSLGLRADPLTKSLDIDFGRDVASRNLKGLATRSDGRILPGPVFTDLTGPKIGDILWVMKPAGPGKFLVGTGPDGKVQEVSFNPKDSSYTVREVADVAETQAIALLPLKDGSLLIGTSPTGALYLFKDGKPVARVPLPADSVFDFLPQPDGSVLAATGNPGKIYRLDLKKLAAAGLIEGKAGDDKLLADKGVTLFGEIRDRNVRRLARLADGSVLAGSSPKGNIYSFDSAGGSPLVLQENRDAEVVDLLPMDDGSFYAALVFTTESTSRLNRPVDPKAADSKDKPPGLEEKPGFTGRSSVVRFPADGFPEAVLARPNVALYRLARHNGWLLLTAGELGDTFGYDPVARRSLTFAGSASSQLNDIAPLGDGRFLLLRNNAPGLALLTFAAATGRELETKRLDLGSAAGLGALRFARLRGVEPKDLKVEVRTNFGSDELEGWTPWTAMTVRDGAFYAEGLRGRYAKFRLQVADTAKDFQLDKATLYHLPQNRRPALTDFRIFSPNLGLLPAGERAPAASVTLGQILAPGRDTKDDSDRRRETLLGSQVVPQPGTQIVYWAVNDPDSDNVTHTFSIRPENADTWTDLAVNTPENYVQFETGGLAEGLYFTRLAVAEQAPRPAAQRLSYTFETDNLLIDRTPPVLAAPVVTRTDGLLRISVSGRDALSLLEGAEFSLNNGLKSAVTHPVDGILDGREETFVAEIPEAQAAGATSVEVILYDRAGNTASTRVPLK
ncbi:MAG TPA: hypothetical protein VGD97_06035 [Lacunisphaera sp.]